MTGLYIDRECPDCHGHGHIEGVRCGICDQGRQRIPLTPEDFKRAFDAAYSTWAEDYLEGEDNESWKMGVVRDVLERLGVPEDMAQEYLAAWTKLLEANPGANIPSDVWGTTTNLLNRDQER